MSEAASMTQSAGAQDLPAVVAETCEVLDQLRPVADASLREWFKYHRHCAQTYAILADTQSDSTVAFEAGWRAGRELLLARDFKMRMTAAARK